MRNWSTLFSSADWCGVVGTVTPLSRSFARAFDTFLAQTVSFYTTFGDSMSIFMIVAPFVVLILLFGSLLWASLSYVHELESFIELLKSSDRESKEQASQPLLITDTLSAAPTTQRNNAADKTFVIFFLVAIFFAQLAAAGMICLLLYRVQAVARTFLVFQQWQYHSTIRGAKAYLICFHVYITIFIHDNPCPFISESQLRDFVTELSRDIEDDTQVLRMQDESHIPIANFDSQLDYLVLGAGCQNVPDSKDLHDVYQCAGSSQLVRIFVSVSMMLTDNYALSNGTLQSADAMTLIHLLTEHLDVVLTGTGNRIAELSEEADSAYTSEMAGLFVAGIVIAFIAFGLARAFLYDLETVFRVLISIVERLPPAAVVANAPLLDYLMNKRHLHARTGMSTPQSIVHNSSDGIILASGLGTIDYVNPTLSSILGFSPEDLLGQPFVKLFEDSKQEEMGSQIKLLQEGQLTSGICERTVNCRTTDESHFVLCLVMIIALYGQDRTVSDFVLIIKDISKDHEREIESQKAKEKSERLLYAIIPRSIAARISAGTDPTFVVPIASIMFLDIVKFSEFSKNLTPEQIMGTLASIFESFDVRIARWGLITKIKLIGDVYMCAAGLFDDARPSAAAEEIVLYALECLQCLDDQNMKMDIALSVRIGINTGGPIIAGVLGNENRVFDIIGDAINVASRLQSTSMPNTIQMSSATHELIAKRALPVLKRDNVILKGKEGAVSTYLLTADSSFSSLLIGQ
jgi:PAS domain S-box-containing protein